MSAPICGALSIRLILSFSQYFADNMLKRVSLVFALVGVSSILIGLCESAAKLPRQLHCSTSMYFKSVSSQVVKFCG
jgi:hypothetical protein